MSSIQADPPPQAEEVGVKTPLPLPIVWGASPLLGQASDSEDSDSEEAGEVGEEDQEEGEGEEGTVQDTARDAQEAVRESQVRTSYVRFGGHPAGHLGAPRAESETAPCLDRKTARPRMSRRRRVQ